MSLFAALRLPREILFGKSQRHALPTVASRFGRRALVCTDERFAGTAVFAEIVKSLQAASMEVLAGVRESKELALKPMPREFLM